MPLYREFATREELDRQYDNVAAVPGSGEIMAGWAERSERARRELDGRLGVRFGPTRAEHLDVFPAAPGAPVHLFVHGGYWCRRTAAEFSFVAPPLVAAGTTAVVANYGLCPDVTMDEIVRQVRASVAWTWANAAAFGGDRDRITLSGHSAGGHLVAMALLTDWAGDYDLPADVIKAGLSVSGLFDLAPFPHTYLQPALRLTPDQVERLSPTNLVPDCAPRLDIVAGAAETNELRRQSRDFFALWSAKGLPGRHHELEGADHFTVLERLAEQPGGLAAGLLP